jgi:hypothetical protein
MGEVYRARDTRLERAVAIKILPAHLSSDPTRKQRSSVKPKPSPVSIIRTFAPCTTWVVSRSATGHWVLLVP